jgi:GNAT superfamily N-acetyltransferase
MKPGEEDRVIRLIVEVFKNNIAPRYSPEGVNEFLRYARSDDLLKRSLSDHFILVAQAGGDIVAMIEIKKYHHISLFFVAGPYQRKGIGKTLLKRAMKICRDRDPWLREISVNASPNAVGAYSQMGFTSRGPERTVKGIRFFPMTAALRKSSFFSSSPA